MENYGFPTVRRLKKPAEFGVVYNNNQTRVKGQYFTVLAFSRFNTVDKPNANGTMTNDFFASRLGVVVSKKISKLAVKRNRVKRLVREDFRQRQHPDGFDFIVIARPTAANSTSLAINQELNKLWIRLHQRCAVL